jgi:hypothetical protein
MSDSVGKVLKASKLLDEAWRESDCPWCAGQLKTLSDMARDMATVLPFTDETAMRVRNGISDDILKVQGKIGVLKQVVVDAMNGGKTPKSPGNRQTFNTSAEHGRFRKNKGARMNKRDTMLIVGSELALGTAVGFGLNRLDEKYTKPGAQWYERVGPAAKVIGGAALTILGATGKVLKTPDMQMIGVAGGGALLSQGALDYAEMLYKGKAPGAIKAPMARAPVYEPRPQPRPLMTVNSY